MGAKILYTKTGADPTRILWPDAGRPVEQWLFTSGTPLFIVDLIGYPDGTITFGSGRAFPITTKNGSTFRYVPN